MKKILGLLFVALMCPYTAFGASLPYHPSTERIKDFITSTAMSEGVSVQLALSVAEAESQFDPLAKNASSSAEGLYQFVKSSWKYFCEDKYKIADTDSEITDYKTATLCAVRLISDGGISNWSASEAKWKPFSES